MQESKQMKPSPFETIESAQEFLELLHLEIGKTQSQIEGLAADSASGSPRQMEALRLVLHKLSQLEKNTGASQRLLHDLRTLRTLLLR